MSIFHSSCIKTNGITQLELLHDFYTAEHTVSLSTLHRESFLSADAVVVYSFLSEDNVEDLRTLSSLLRPDVDSGHRPKLVLWGRECPAQMLIKTNHSKLENVSFDYTMTYRRDSDVFFPYTLRVLPKTEKDPLALVETHWNKKVNGILWLVSHCKGRESGRMEFAKKLQKELDSKLQLDILGLCGTSNAVSGDRVRVPDSVDTYKFYLAFENSLCKDYITEKFYKTLSHPVIPIVRGAPVSDYEALAPPNSFIHVDQYKSIKSLARHLISVAGNETLYKGYLNWKSDYSTVTLTRLPPELEPYCELCRLLHENVPSKRSYAEGGLYQWWEREAQCQSIANEDYSLNENKS